MKNTLLLIGGVIQVAGSLFHLLMARAIHTSQSLSSDERALMQMLNIGSILMGLFFAYVCFFHRDELLSTRLGNAMVIFISVTYFARAVGEIIFPSFSLMWFVLCLVVGAGYLSILVLRT